jgi:ferredoxin-NADP reductase
MNAYFQSSTGETESVHTYFFKPTSDFIFTAGQFIEMTVPHNDTDSRGTKRWFTISSSPDRELLSITTKLTSEDGSTYKKALRRLVPGDEVQISAPMGDFVLPKLLQTPIIFVGVGIGLTPFLSMLRWLTDMKEGRPIKLIHAVSNEEDMVFQDIFDDAKVHATVVVSNPSPSWGGVRGHVTAEMILGLEEPTPDSLVYISGPEQIVESLTKDLVKTGLRKDQIVGDYFPGYPDPA